MIFHSNEEKTVEVILSELDYVRLTKVLDEYGSSNLEHMLEVADVTNSVCIPRDLVTMNSRIVYHRLSDQKVDEITIVYPPLADSEEKRISVLSPLGRAFLAKYKGDMVSCELPDGKKEIYLIQDILYQPESAGDFHL
jgi:regulator of nucleoside diphosphate kinase